MKIVVNGAPANANTAPETTTAEILRGELGLTGTKLVCGSGVCGACTILVDGAPAASCLLPAAALEERSVTTVEGLGGTHPAQRAFAAHDALQCGYCTPGFVVEAAAFVDRWRAEHGDTAPERETIAEAMAGHLCRCGAYEGIYAAIAAACAGKHDEEPEEGSWPRAEAMEKITGRARYTTDVRPDGCLEGVIVRSSRAHARIGAVDAGGATHVELLPEDRTVRYVGQPILAVAAATRAKALAAAEQVAVSYEPLPAVLDMDRAREPDSPLVYPTKQEQSGAPSNAEGATLPGRWRGNVRATMGASWRSATAIRRLRAAAEDKDPRLVAGEFSTPVQVHTPLEPHSCVAYWDARGELHLHASTQAVGLLAQEAAQRWGLDASQVHAAAEHVGGGFGSKSGLSSETIAAAELARAARAPVRVALDRSEELTDTGNRPGTRTRLALLADGSGDLSALSMDVYGDGGVSVSSTVAVLARLMYGHAPRRLRDFDAVTNHAPGKPFRGPGAAPMLWALEQGVDEMAHRLGEDPIALRRRWDGNPKRRALYDWAAALPEWLERPAPGSQSGRFRRGVGVAAANWQYLVNPGTEVELTVEDGAVVARTATQDIGTGVRSVLTGILRDELDLPPEKVRVLIGRSDTVQGPPSFGSQTTTSVAPAAHDAARQLRAALRGRAVGDPEAEGTRVVGQRRRDRRGYATPFRIGPGLALGRGFSGAVHITEVEVDTRLGRIRPTRVWAGVAAGRIYAPRLARNQCEGAVVQGIGYALYEERRTDPATGAVLTANLEDYRLPGIGDTPETVVHFHEEGWDHVTGGGVGLGEVSLVGVPASLGNAVYNATGWRPRDLPIHPDRLLEGINS